MPGWRTRQGAYSISFIIASSVRPVNGRACPKSADKTCATKHAVVGEPRKGRLAVASGASPPSAGKPVVPASHKSLRAPSGATDFSIAPDGALFVGSEPRSTGLALLRRTGTRGYSQAPLTGLLPWQPLQHTRRLPALEHQPAKGDPMRPARGLTDWVKAHGAAKRSCLEYHLCKRTLRQPVPSSYPPIRAETGHDGRMPWNNFNAPRCVQASPDTQRRGPYCSTRVVQCPAPARLP